MNKLVALLVVSTLLSAGISAKSSLGRDERNQIRHLSKLLRENRQAEQTVPWETVGQVVGNFLVNFVSDDTFQMLTGFLTAGNDLLRTADEYLDISEAFVTAIQGIVQNFLAPTNNRQGKQANDPFEIVSQLSEGPFGSYLDTVTIVTQLLRDNWQSRQGSEIGDVLLSITSSLNDVIRDLRATLSTAVEIFSRITDIRTQAEHSRQTGQTVNPVESLTNFMQSSSTSLSMLTGDFAHDVTVLWESFSVLLRDLEANLNATYSSGTIRFGQSNFNMYDMLGDVYQIVYTTAVEAMGLQTSEQDLRTLLADLNEAVAVSTAYSNRMTTQLQSLTGAVSASSVSSGPFDGILQSFSRAMRSVAVIIADTAKYLVDITDVSSKALDDMHRLESDFTKAWVAWFPSEWGFDDRLSGWYNAGRLVAAASRFLDGLQSSANSVAEALNTGSTVMNDAAQVAASAVDPALIDSFRRLVQG